MSTGALPGFRDFYPAELAARDHLFGVWRDVARRFAFVEYDGPPLEPLDLYTRKSGDEIVGQLYNFTDKGGREVALRPEMTPTFARMVAARANALRKPVRWFSVPQLFRYERQQRGRLREHYQLNVDIVGEPDVTADAELLAVAISIMQGVGLTAADVRARVSDRRLLAAVLRAEGIDDAHHDAAFQAIDKIEREPRERGVERMVEAGVNADVAASVLALVAASDTTLATLRSRYAADADVLRWITEGERYFGYLDALGVGDWATLDLRIVRGLAYYTGIVFELFDAKGQLRAICGGGRYDTLLQSLGGIDLPALGFGMGDVVLGELIRERGLAVDATPSLDYWIAPKVPTPGSFVHVMRVASQLRARGHRVEYALRDQSLGKQFKAAVSAGASAVLVVDIAPDNPKATPTTGTLRRLSDGVETAVQLEEFLRDA
jgi:histidyl-tRNA synthetase